jgi:GNAT superfamily N-acetyltransferase
MFATEVCTFRLANVDDVPALVGLVNAAYSGDGGQAGWTDEMHLVGGRRTDHAEIAELVATRGVLMLLCLLGDEVVGSVLLQRRPGTAYLAMFVVKPSRQAAGFGTSLLRTAETLARRLWGARRMTLTSITLRPELIEFYKRRGYRLTGEFLPFPPSATVRPLVPGIELAELQKDLAHPPIGAAPAWSTLPASAFKEFNTNLH